MLRQGHRSPTCTNSNSMHLSLSPIIPPTMALRRPNPTPTTAATHIDRLSIPRHTRLHHLRHLVLPSMRRCLLLNLLPSMRRTYFAVQLDFTPITLLFRANRRRITSTLPRLSHSNFILRRSRLIYPIS